MCKANPVWVWVFIVLAGLGQVKLMEWVGDGIDWLCRRRRGERR